MRLLIKLFPVSKYEPRDVFYIGEGIGARLGITVFTTGTANEENTELTASVEENSSEYKALCSLGFEIHKVTYPCGIKNEEDYQKWIKGEFEIIWNVLSEQSERGCVYIVPQGNLEKFLSNSGDMRYNQTKFGSKEEAQEFADSLHEIGDI